MDKEVLEQQLQGLCAHAVQQARTAVAAASEGQWIAGSEWQVREIFQHLTRDCYQALIQARADAHASASQAVFSPGGRCSPAEQRPAKPAGADRRRGD